MCIFFQISELVARMNRELERDPTYSITVCFSYFFLFRLYFKHIIMIFIDSIQSEELVARMNQELEN